MEHITNSENHVWRQARCLKKRHLKILGKFQKFISKCHQNPDNPTKGSFGIVEDDFFFPGDNVMFSLDLVLSSLDWLGIWFSLEKYMIIQGVQHICFNFCFLN